MSSEVNIKEQTEGKFETVEQLYEAYKKVNKENNKRYDENRVLKQKIKEYEENGETPALKVEDTKEYKDLLEKYNKLKNAEEPQKDSVADNQEYNISAHKYKKGDQVWLPYYTKSNEATRMYGKIQEEYKFIPTFTTIRDVIVADEIKYRIAKYGGCFDENLIVKSKEECIELCNKLNQRA